MKSHILRTMTTAAAILSLAALPLVASADDGSTPDNSADIQPSPQQMYPGFDSFVQRLDTVGLQTLSSAYNGNFPSPVGDTDDGN